MAQEARHALLRLHASKVINPDTGEPAWKTIERKARTKKREAVEKLKDLQATVDAGTFKPAATSVHELGLRWLREHVQSDLKPSTAANYRQTFHSHVSPALG